MKLTAQEKEMFRQEYLKLDYSHCNQIEAERYIEASVESITAYAEVEGFLVVFRTGKPSTLFPIGWGETSIYGSEEEVIEAWNKLDKEKYFFEENVRCSSPNLHLKVLEDSTAQAVAMTLYPKKKHRIANLVAYHRDDSDPRTAFLKKRLETGNACILGEQDRQLLIDILERELEMLEEQLRTYLEINGTSELEVYPYHIRK